MFVLASLSDPPPRWYLNVSVADLSPSRSRTVNLPLSLPFLFVPCSFPFAALRRCHKLCDCTVRAAASTPRTILSFLSVSHRWPKIAPASRKSTPDRIRGEIRAELEADEPGDEIHCRPRNLYLREREVKRKRDGEREATIPNCQCAIV